MTADRPQRRRRGVLVVPGSAARKIDKALTAGADEVVIDLEDAVTPDQKVAAREAVVERLRTITSPVTPSLGVRINALSTEWGADDLTALSYSGAALSTVVVPKVETAADLEAARDLLGTHDASLQALIESPRGVQSVEQICAATTGLVALIIGYADLGAALGRASDLPPERWLGTQERILTAARSAGLAALDGPHLGIAADEAFRRSARWARELGFDGKWVIHPAQLAPVISEFTPDDAAVSEARRVLAAVAAAAARGHGAVQLDGRMLDEAVAVAARRVLIQVGD